MRLIVDLYRYIVIGTLGLLIAGAVFGGLQLAVLPPTGAPYLAFYVLGAIVLIASVIMALGITATIISIHDQHEKLVEEVRAWRTEFYFPDSVK